MQVSATRASRYRPETTSDPYRDHRRSLPARAGASDMPNIFAVVGEHREKPDHLLVLGEDGGYYDYVLATGQTLPVEPDQSWATDTTAPELEQVLARDDASALLLNL